jgi:hypothetical protein
VDVLSQKKPFKDCSESLGVQTLAVVGLVATTIVADLGIEAIEPLRVTKLE